MSRVLRKCIAILSMAFLPALGFANACATMCALAHLGGDQTAVTSNDNAAPCESGQCEYANLCDLAQSAFVTATPLIPVIQALSDLVPPRLMLAISVEPQPPLKPPVA